MYKSNSHRFLKKYFSICIIMNNNYLKVTMFKTIICLKIILKLFMNFEDIRLVCIDAFSNTIQVFFGVRL